MTDFAGDPTLIDKIYEAAFVPERWTDVLSGLGAVSGAADGILLVFDDIKPIRFKATEISHDILADFYAGESWKDNERIPYFHEKPTTGFVIAQDYYPEGFLDRDYPYQYLRQLGLESQIGTVIPMPSGELVAFALQKWARDGNFGVEDVKKLDQFHPHLARAGLIAARLGLERAHAMVSTLHELGLPAAVLTSTGRVLTANSLMEATSSIFVPVAFGGMAISDHGANRLFQEAIQSVRTSAEPVVRSIPIPAKDEQPPLVIHLLPLRGAAQDIFSGASVLVAATAVTASAMVPAPSILTGLFDLTPAEARLATGLASGQSLKEAAVASGLRISTVRTYLDRVFRKTGTNQQSQLVALLKSAQPFSR